MTAAALSGCAPYHCRQAPPTTPPIKEAQNNAMDANLGATSRRVLVYKYDGSLQCGQGKGVSADSMAKDLKGINVFSSSKRKDGLMHIQVCGAATGSANVFEINEPDLSQAEKRGFKKWTYE